MKKDFLIIGGGLAGSLLAWELSKHGKSFQLVDELPHDGSSHVAAGIINPVTGKRFILVENFSSYFDKAERTYSEFAETFQQSFLKKIPIIRIFKNAKEHQFWNEERNRPEHLRHLKKFNPGGIYKNYVSDSFGSLTFDGYYVHGSELIQAIHSRFKDNIVYTVFHHRDLTLKEKSVEWQDCSFERVIFCEGYQAEHNPYFDWIPFKSAKGEILTVQTENHTQPDGILNFGKWMQPLGEGLWKVGATFQWEDINNTPSVMGRKELTRALDQFCTQPYTVIHHTAGVRPVVRDLKPLLGAHPKHPHLLMLNGFGAKGYLHAPAYTQNLIDFLVHQKAIPASLCISRFFE